MVKSIGIIFYWMNCFKLGECVAFIFALLAGIWSFTANRFRYEECFMIILAGGSVGLGIAVLIKTINSMFKNK